MKTPLYVLIAILVWLVAAWVFLDASQDIMDKRFIDDFCVTYHPTEGSR